MKKKMFNYIFLILFTSLFLSNSSIAVSLEKKHRPATSLNTVNYAKNLSLSIVDNNFRGSWVIDPEKNALNNIKLQKSFNTLAQVKIGSTARDVNKVLGTPQEVKFSGKLWIYGKPAEDGTYKSLTQVFFDDKQEHVTAITSFNPKNIVENIGVAIGDPIDKMITIYGEPVDEKDFIEDQDNKDYLGMYYLYPRAGIGFLIGQDKGAKSPIVQGVIVFGNN